MTNEYFNIIKECLLDIHSDAAQILFPHQIGEIFYRLFDTIGRILAKSFEPAVIAASDLSSESISNLIKIVETRVESFSVSLSQLPHIEQFAVAVRMRLMEKVSLLANKK